MQKKVKISLLFFVILPSLLLFSKLSFALTKVKFLEMPINLVNQTTIQFIILANNTGNTTALCNYIFGTEYGNFNITANKTKFIIFNITFPTGINSITQSIYVNCNGNTLANYSASKTFYAPPIITTTIKDKYSVFQIINFTVLSVTSSYPLTINNMTLYLDNNKIPKFNSTLRSYTLPALKLTTGKHSFLLILNTSLYNATKYYDFEIYKPKYKLMFIFNQSVKPEYLGNRSTLIVNFTMNYKPVLLNISVFNITIKNDLTNKTTIKIPFQYLKNYKKITIYANVSVNKTVIYKNETYVILDEDLPKLITLNYPKYVKNNYVIIKINATDNTSPLIFISANNSTGFIKSSKLSNFTIKNLEPGKNNITLKIYDLGGNYIEKNITVYYDNKNPKIFVNISVNNKTNVSFCYVNISVEDNHLVKFFKIILNGKIIYSKFINSSKFYLKDFKINLTLGKNSIVFFANDSSNRINETKYAIEMDNEPPVLEIINPNVTTEYFGNMPVYITAKDNNLDYIEVITSSKNSTKFYRNETKFEVKCGNLTIIACDTFKNCIFKKLNVKCGNVKDVSDFPNIIDYVELFKGNLHIYKPNFKIIIQKNENGSYVVLNRTTITLRFYNNTEAYVKFMIPIPKGYAFRGLMIDMVNETKKARIIGNYVSFVYEKETSNSISNSTINIYFSKVSNFPMEEKEEKFLVSMYKIGNSLIYNFTSQNVKKKTILTGIKGLNNITVELYGDTTKGSLMIKKIDNKTYLLIPKNCTILLSLKNSTCGKELSSLSSCKSVETSRPLYVRINEPFSEFSPQPKNNQNIIHPVNYTQPNTSNESHQNETSNLVIKGANEKFGKKIILMIILLLILTVFGIFGYLYYSGKLSLGEKSEKVHLGFLSSHQNYVNNPQYERMYEKIINEWIDYVSKLLLEGKQEYEIVRMLKEKGFTSDEIERIIKNAEMKAGFR